MKKIVLTGLSLILIISAAVAYTFLSRQPFMLSEVPDISLSIIDGRKINLKSAHEGPLLVTFLATTCPSCLKEMPHLIELYHELNKDGLEIVGIAMPYDPPNLVVALSKQKNIPYPIALDIDGSATRAFGDVSLTPTSFLIDQNGYIIQQETGTIDIGKLRDKIKKLLNTSNTTISAIKNITLYALV